LLLVSTFSPFGQAESEKRKHWAFQPIVNPPIPTVLDRAWPSLPIDHFILRELTYRFASRDFRLTYVHGRVVRGILA